MKRFMVSTCLAATVFMTTGTAMADSIKGKLGVTGKIGLLVPADNESDFYHNKTDAGLTGSVGLLYGVDDHIAAELEVSRTSFSSENGDFGMTDVSLSGQYRFANLRRQLVPYLGGGLDILVSNYDPYDGTLRNVDTTLGAHINGGFDYFLQKELALTAEVNVVVAPNANITDGLGDHRGNFDPTNFSTTVGVRYFFN